jgi:zinc protease
MKRRWRSVAAVGAVAALALTASRAASEPVLLPVPNDPTISFRLWFKVGAQDDPPGKEGLAALTAAMLAEGGTQRHSYAEILDRLYPLATTYEATPGREMTVVAGRVHRDNLAEFYPLFLDAVLAPAFRAEDLDRLRSRTLNFLETTLRFSSDEELGKAVLYQEIFDGTSYAHPSAGTIQGVKSITLDEIRKFHRTYYTRDNVVIGLGGGFDQAGTDSVAGPSAKSSPPPPGVTPASVLAQLQTDLARLPAGVPRLVPPPAGKRREGVRVTLIEKQTDSTAISLGFPISVLRGSKEWYALAVANSWLGEHRNTSARLFQVIRDQRGLNYGDYSYLEHFPAAGHHFVPPPNVSRRQQIFEIWIRPVPHDARHFALRAALRELQLLVDRGLTREDFELKRRFLKNYVLHYAPTTMDRLGYALDDRFYGLPESHLVRFRRMMDELTLEEVNATIRKHWQTSHLQVAAVTEDAAAFAEALVQDTPSLISYPTPKPPEVLEEDKAISSYPIQVEREHMRIIPVAELFAK